MEATKNRPHVVIFPFIFVSQEGNLYLFDQNWGIKKKSAIQILIRQTMTIIILMHVNVMVNLQSLSKVACDSYTGKHKFFTLN